MHLPILLCLALNYFNQFILIGGICSAGSRVIIVVAEIISVLICNLFTPFFYNKKKKSVNYHVVAKYYHVIYFVCSKIFIQFKPVV